MQSDRPTVAPAQLRVVELGSWLAAPGAAALLVDIGAEVIKIEPPAGDPARRWIAAMGGESETTPSFSLLNRGKKSVVLDLSHQADLVHLSELLRTADVFVTNLRGGSLARMNLDPETVLAVHPRLIYASISGLGLNGPDRDAAVYDVGGFWARSGLIHQITDPASAPATPTGGFGDMVTALALYSGIVTALLRRQHSGRGGLVDTSLLRAGAYMVSGDLAVQAAHGRVHGQSTRTESRTPLVNSYRSADGRWFYLTCIEAKRHYPKVCAAVDRLDLIGDPRFSSARAIRRNGRELIQILDHAFLQRTLAQWAVRFEENDVWWQPAATPQEAMADAQMAANGMLRPIWDGSVQYPMVTAPFRLTGEQGDATRAPALGEHTAIVLASLTK